jgi:hypothetical protein
MKAVFLMGESDDLGDCRGSGLGSFVLGYAGSFGALPFLESADGRSSKLKANLLAIDNKGLLLKVWLPDLAGLLLGKRNIVSELLSLAGNVACV